MRPCLQLLSSKARSGSSARWLARSRQDPFKASSAVRSTIYVARSAHKLQQLDDRFRFLRPGRTVLELGAAPGGWTQVCMERMKGRGRIIAVDLLDLDSRVLAAKHAGILTALNGDLREEDTLEAIHVALSGQENAQERQGQQGQVDVVLSDMLANTTGNSIADTQASLELCQLVLELGMRYLRKSCSGGIEASAMSDPTLVLKILQSQQADEWRKGTLQSIFASVKMVKPDASRKESKECYIVAKGWKEKTSMDDYNTSTIGS